MPHKHPNTERIGGPGASHENRKEPEKSQPRNAKPADTKSWRHSGVSGGGGEHDSHHTHDPVSKGGHQVRAKVDGVRSDQWLNKRARIPASRESEFAVSERGMNQESDHNKHNEGGQSGHKPQRHTGSEEKGHG